MPGRRIMVVDDDADTLKCMTTLLELYVYQVLAHSSPSDTVAQVLHYQPHLVILDLNIHVPDTGWYVFQALRASPTTARVPVLLYSSKHSFHCSHRDEVRAMDGDVLEKPFKPAALLRAVKAIVAA